MAMSRARNVVGSAPQRWADATKGSEGDSHPFGKGVDHERRNGRHHRHGGCAGGAVSSGDSVNFTGAYKLTPKQTITSP